ncbi:hypothetical protein AVEN_221308-1 [Araneus ventricosus]|uniref:Transposase Tc1-like domain-containing protein n=1 Tax=Araneus ventricosus TaxID=182803 RepID=A0A4Y2AZR2_ARAVE|nr:hypothetical protein AVEN_221308-1 [Araneus ventricosus]
MGKSHDLKDIEKGMIIGYRARGGSISETAAFVKCSRSAVMNVYNNWKNQEGAQSRLANCGTPRAINDRRERRLRRLVKSDRRATVDTLTAQMNQQCIRKLSRTTVQRTLLRIGLRSRRLISAPMLTTVNRKKRCAFALQHKHWTLEQWEKVAFSVESRFLLHWNHGRWRIRRETSENKLPGTIIGCQQGGGGSVMVWVMFSLHALGPLIPVEGTLNSCAYLSIVADQVHPYLATVYPANDGVFQQDNATCMCPKLSVHGPRSMMKSSSYYPGLQIPQILTLEKICRNISIDTSDRKTLHLGIFTSYVMLCCSHGHRCLSPSSKHALSPRPAA